MFVSVPTLAALAAKQITPVGDTPYPFDSHCGPPFPCGFFSLRVCELCREAIDAGNAAGSGFLAIAASGKKDFATLVVHYV